MYEDVAYRFVEHLSGLPMPWTALAITTTRCGTARRDSSTTCLHFLERRCNALEKSIDGRIAPLCASSVFEADGIVARHPRLRALIDLFKSRHPDLLKHIARPMAHS